MNDCPVIVPVRRGFAGRASFCFLCGTWTNNTLTYSIEEQRQHMPLCSQHTLLETLQAIYEILVIQERSRGRRAPITD